MSGKKGSPAGGDGQMRQKSPVAEMSQWSEAIKQQKASQKVYEHFSINPHQLFPFSEKPTENIILQKKLETTMSSNPFADSNYMKSKLSVVSNDDLSGELKNKLTTMNYGPRLQYKFPQTSNQELGWYQEAARSLSPKRPGNRFDFPKKTCNETQYANDYFTMLQVSPFSNKFK